MFTNIIIFLAFIQVINCVSSVKKQGLSQDNENSNVNSYIQRNEYPRETNPSAIKPDNLVISAVSNWSKNVDMGQVSGVSVDAAGNIYVFHRANRVWNMNSFYPNNTFVDTDLPIRKPTVAIIHPKTGTVIYQWGSNMFYLPHGITVDFENNVWITDVAMHQIFKFPPLLNSESRSNNLVPSLTLGRKFIPGNSETLFCKPSAISVLRSGEFFVSDGYCNARIIKFSADGTKLLIWGRPTLTHGPAPPPPYFLFIPHDLTLMEDRNLICASDRENGRIQCFRTSDGNFEFQKHSPQILGTRIFSAAYTPQAGGLFFIVNGPSNYFGEEVRGCVIEANSDSLEIIKTFQPSDGNFQNPHDIFVSPNGSEFYVAELDPHRISKFLITYKTAESPSVVRRNTEDEKSVGTMLMAIFITAVVLCFGAALMTAALIYSKARTRGCSGHCKNTKWLIGRSTVEGFKLGNFLGQQRQGFVKLNNLGESDEDEANVSATFA